MLKSKLNINLHVLAFLCICNFWKPQEINASVIKQSNSPLVSIEIRFCDFPDHQKKGVLFINGRKQCSIKSGEKQYLNHPADSSLHLKIKIGKSEFTQDGFYIIEKTGGVISIDYFFKDSLELGANSKNKSNMGWIGVRYFPRFAVSVPAHKKKIHTGKSLVGGERDSHGCLGSGGYIWSDAAQSCIRVWETGVPFTKVNTDSLVPSPANFGYVVFSTDGNWAELFSSSKWDVNNNRYIWLLEKFGNEWRYSGNVNIAVIAEKNDKLDIYINKNKLYSINKK